MSAERGGRAWSNEGTREHRGGSKGPCGRLQSSTFHYSSTCMLADAHYGWWLSINCHSSCTICDTAGLALIRITQVGLHGWVLYMKSLSIYLSSLWAVVMMRSMSSFFRAPDIKLPDHRAVSNVRCGHTQEGELTRGQGWTVGKQVLFADVLYERPQCGHW